MRSGSAAVRGSPAVKFSQPSAVIAITFKSTPNGAAGWWWPGLLWLEDGELRMAGSTLIGPSAPPGYPGRSAEALEWVGVQAFELTAQNVLLASNATVVGVW